MRNQKGFTTVIMIIAAEAVIFLLFYFLSPLHNQLMKLNKSNRVYEYAHIMGEEFGAMISQSYYNAFNHYPRPADSKILCEGGVFLSVSIPRRGSLIRLTNSGDSSGDYALLCLPDTGFNIKHPLAPEQLVFLGEPSSSGTSYSGWLRLVRDPLKIARSENPVERSSQGFLNNLFGVSLNISYAQDPRDFKKTLVAKNSIEKKSFSKLVWEPMAPEPPPGTVIIDELSSVVESVNCLPNKSHHCIAYKFCPKINQDLNPCEESEFVWQVIALPKLPKSTVDSCDGFASDGSIAPPRVTSSGAGSGAGSGSSDSDSGTGSTGGGSGAGPRSGIGEVDEECAGRNGDKSNCFVR